MTTQTTLYATRDFKDAGTTRTFKGGEKITECSEGELLNYREAGLASEDKPDDAAEFMKADEPKAAKTGTKAS